MATAGLGEQGRFPSQAFADGPSAHGGPQEDGQLERLFVDQGALRPTWFWSQHSQTWSPHILSGKAPVASTFCPAKWEGRSLGAGKFWKTEKFWPCCYSQLGPARLSKQVDAHMLGDDCGAAPISSYPPPPPNCLTHVGKAQPITTSSSPICGI